MSRGAVREYKAYFGKAGFGQIAPLSRSPHYNDEIHHSSPLRGHFQKPNATLIFASNNEKITIKSKFSRYDFYFRTISSGN